MARSRPASPAAARTFVEGGWLGPWWLERQRDDTSLLHLSPRDPRSITNYNFRSSTTIGSLDAEHLVSVDPRGLVVTGPGRWALDWWIGADDRWHIPAREPTVRQRLVDGAPVVETLLRIPSGEAIERVCVVRAGADNREVAVVEFENASTLPFALALAVRPYDGEGLGGIGSIDLDEGAVVIDGAPGLLLPKPPSRAVGAVFEAGDAGDSAHSVLTGEAPEQWTRAVSCRYRLAQAAFVFPLAHRATMRIVMPLGDRPPTALGALPTAAQVAKGWNVQARRGLRVELPASRLADAFAANRNYLLLARPAVDVSSPDGRLYLAALDQCGYHEEVAEALGALGSGSDAGVVHPQLDHWRITGDEAWLAQVKRYWTGLASVIRHRGSGRSVLRQWLEQPSPPLVELEVARRSHPRRRPYHELRQALAEIEREEADRALERINWAVEVASPTFTWPRLIPPDLRGASRGVGHDPDAVAAFVLAVRAMLVREEGEHGLALCSVFPESWLGAPVEVHDAPTRLGRLSFALRWHGERPALLWELQPHAGVESVRITAPRLDPAWESAALKGDALLRVPA